MTSITPRFLLAGAAALLLLGACAKEHSATDTKEETLATVNGTAIPKSRVDLVVKQGGRGRADTPEARKAILDQLVMQTLIASEATKKGMDKSAEVKEQLEVLKQAVLADTYVQDYFKNNPPGDSEVQAEYDKVKTTMTGTEYKARHILVASEAEAKDIIAKLGKDASAFEKLAAQKSLDPGSKARGGDLGWFDRGQMVPEFGDAVAKLEKGKFTTQPVKTQFGYHIILLEDSRPIQPPPFDAIKSQLTQQVQEQKLRKHLDELKAKAKIEIAGAPAALAPAK